MELSRAGEGGNAEVRRERGHEEGDLDDRAVPGTARREGVYWEDDGFMYWDKTAYADGK